MPAKFVNIGYYICRHTVCPEYIGTDTDKMISVSDCLCVHEPQYQLCHGWKPHGDDKDYIKQFADKESYLKMSSEITRLLSDNKFFTDGRFLHKDDALHFYKCYFQGSEYTLVSVCTEGKYIKCLGEDFIIDTENTEDTDGELIGCDIIGRDVYGFHSFLCNSLHEELGNVRFNSYVLIENSFEETARMAKAIEGKGEPVKWLPVMIRKI